jgi:hypothetical protein
MFEQLAGTVVFLHQEFPQTTNINGIEYEIVFRPVGKDTLIPQKITKFGSGFLVHDNNALFLVTAQHVAKEMNANALATIRTAEDKPITFTLGKLSGNKTTIKWVYHEKADVAVLPLYLDSNMLPHFKEHFLPISILVSELIAPSRELSLLTVGFPLGLGVQERFSPISRESKSASGLLIIPRFDTKVPNTFYLLDSPSIGGFSGAPLFEIPGAYSSEGGLVVGGKLACVGLVHGTVSDDTGGKLAAVVPSALVVETINKAKLEMGKR